MLVPPAELASVQRAPVEMVFVLDCSGSMSGRPIEQSKNAMRRALRSMNPNDTFQVIRFSENASALGPRPVPATPENIQHALRYVDSLHGSGGTQMIEGIRAALDFPHDPERLRFVVFLTDGYIGNEAQILGAVQDKLGDARIFSFGVGSSPNRYLLDRMAMLGRGVVGYLGLNDSASDVMDGFFERVSHPALTDVSLDLAGYSTITEAEVYPRTARDLFVGRPVIITGRIDGALPESIRVHGRMSGEDWAMDVPLASARSGENKALASIWARTKIADLMDEMAWTGDASIAGSVENLALSYGLMSQFTAFVAVDSLTVTQGSYGVTVAQPVPVPEGVKYETTVR
jgi:Ca-activated chloride channel family protein